MAEPRRPRQLEAGIERKLMVGLGGRLLAVGRRVESDAAQQQGTQRFHLEGDAAIGELHREAGSVPERRVIVDILVVGRAHEGMDRDAVRQITQVPAQHGADLEIAEVDRRAQADRAQPLALQLEGRALGPGLQDRRILFADEMMPRHAFLGRRAHADVGTGQQRLQAGDISGEELRLDHPEDRLVVQERLGLAHRLHRHQHMGEVGRDGDGLHRAHHHVLVLELGLAGGEACGRLEGDDDGGPALGEGIPGEPRRNQGGDQRNDPDQRNAPAAMNARRRQLSWPSAVAHCRSIPPSLPGR